MRLSHGGDRMHGDQSLPGLIVSGLLLDYKHVDIALAEMSCAGLLQFVINTN